MGGVRLREVSIPGGLTVLRGKVKSYTSHLRSTRPELNPVGFCIMKQLGVLLLTLKGTLGDRSINPPFCYVSQMVSGT